MLADLLAVYVAGFVLVFAQGFQSRNVNNGNYRWAAGTSLIIGSSFGTLVTKISNPAVGHMGGLVYGIAGACAIVTAMYVHERFVKKPNDGTE
jgi:hypothetical protein